MNTKCCSAGCSFIDEDQPCWGEIEVIDELDVGDGYEWIHACEGHRACLDDGQKAYKSNED